MKFANYFIHHPEAIPTVLENFMSERGVLSQWPKLSSRSSFFLLRFIDRLKSKLGDCAELIFAKSQDVIKMYEEGNTKLLPHDIENFYEIIGSMCETFHLPPQKVKETVQTYFELVHSKLSSMKDPHIGQVIDLVRRLNMLIKSLSKERASLCNDLLVEMSKNFDAVFEQFITTPIQECTVFVQKSLTIVGNGMMEVFDEYI